MLLTLPGRMHLLIGKETGLCNSGMPFLTSLVAGNSCSLKSFLNDPISDTHVIKIVASSSQTLANKPPRSSVC